MPSSIDTSKIPVKNIFYMLVYAWNYPLEKRTIPVEAKDEKDLLNLFSKLLIMKLSSLIKRGFYKEYRSREETSSVIKGKIMFKESIETFETQRGRLHFTEDQFTYDILHNQLIKATIRLVLKQPGIEPNYQESLKRLLSYFNHVSDIKVTINMFDNIKIHRNNHAYDFILQICYFIWQQTLLHEESGVLEFDDFTRNHHKMAKLFEDFVKNFYRGEIANSKVSGQHLHWPVQGEMHEHMPIMKTDIYLSISDTKYIIDTKFYHNLFLLHHGKESLRSAHIYQLFSYLKNDEYETGRKATGILLYPKVEKDVTLRDNMLGFDIRVCTVNLYDNWKNIHARLLKILS